MEFMTTLWSFLKTRKKFWLLPAIIVLLGVGAVVIAAGSSVVAPFIYTIF